MLKFPLFASQELNPLWRQGSSYRGQVGQTPSRPLHPAKGMLPDLSQISV